MVMVTGTLSRQVWRRTRAARQISLAPPAVAESTVPRAHRFGAGGSTFSAISPAACGCRRVPRHGRSAHTLPPRFTPRSRPGAKRTRPRAAVTGREKHATSPWLCRWRTHISDHYQPSQSICPVRLPPDGLFSPSSHRPAGRCREAVPSGGSATRQPSPSGGTVERLDGTFVPLILLGRRAAAAPGAAAGCGILQKWETPGRLPRVPPVGIALPRATLARHRRPGPATRPGRPAACAGRCSRSAVLDPWP